MNAQAEQTPSPGSNEAITAGCTCPVIDNAYGRGYMGWADIFVMFESCPLHNKEARKTAQRAEIECLTGAKCEPLTREE